MACNIGCHAARKRCSAARLLLSSSIWARSTLATRWIVSGTGGNRITVPSGKPGNCAAWAAAVAAVQPDGALFSSDFRAPERLFALLMQAAGRAGRDAAYMAAQGTQCEMWVQSFHPQHAVFEALRTHDYPAFATQQLKEREEAAMPPFSYQALVRADARTQEVAQGFLSAATAAVHATGLPGLDLVTLFPPVPLTIQRVANVERAQMLMESPSRAALQRFLAAWQPVLQTTRSQPEHKGLIRWLVDVDPLAI